MTYLWFRKWPPEALLSLTDSCQNTVQSMYSMTYLWFRKWPPEALLSLTDSCQNTVQSMYSMTYLWFRKWPPEALLSLTDSCEGEHSRFLDAAFPRVFTLATNRLQQNNLSKKISNFLELIKYK